jgi:hypothetical protein
VEVLLIPVSELEALKSFESNGQLVLSAYICLEGMSHKDEVSAEFRQQLSRQLSDCNARPECRKAIEEDLEIIDLYLKTNGHRKHAGLALFSCAARYFWRAFPLPVAIPTRITAGRKFDLAPLLQLAELEAQK